MGGDHGGDHKPPYVVPHHSVYDKPDEVPLLKELKEKLAKKGLKDPWMRNEIYKYQFWEVSIARRAYMSLGGRTILIGLGLGMGLGYLDKLYDQYYDTHTHHGGDSHGHGGH